MAIVSFSLNEGGVIALQNALLCILRFCDDVSMEAAKDKFILSGLNMTKSAHVSFAFSPDRFFSPYSYEGSAQYRDRFHCLLYIKSLLSIFRARVGGDPGRDRERETAIERCDVAVEDGRGKRSRFISRIVCRNGITATHSIPFEVKAPTRVRFDPQEAVHHWTIASRTLRQLMDYFGPGIDLLDINTEGEGVVNFACYTEKEFKLSNDAAILKKPLHTSIAVDMEEFDIIEVEEKLHIIIAVKDFRAILQHATVSNSSLSAQYSKPGRPVRLSYSSDSISCTFILMTVGERDTINGKARRGRNAVSRNEVPHKPALMAASSRTASAADGRVDEAQDAQQAPKDPATNPAVLRPSQFGMRPPPLPPPPTLRSESMFVGPDEDHQWEPVNEDLEEDGGNGFLGWDASNAPNPPTARISEHANHPVAPAEAQSDAAADVLLSGLEPTQRLSEVRLNRINIAVFASYRLWTGFGQALIKRSQVRRFGLFS